MARAGTFADEEVDFRPEAPDLFHKDYRGPVLDLTPTLADDPNAVPVSIELVCNNRIGWGYTEWHEATYADGSTSGWPRSPAQGDDEPEDDDLDTDDCGMTDEGLCMYAGSEWCDFECPLWRTRE